MTLVVDTSGVLAAKDADHPEHEATASVLEREAGPLILSPFVAAECDYMLARSLGTLAAREFVGEVTTRAFQIADIDAGDMAVIAGVIDRYADLRVGIADASLVLLCARHQTTRVLTLDRRHFRAMAPLWGSPAFAVLPDDD